MGNVALQDLTARHIQAMYAKMLAKVSARTGLHTHRILRETLSPQCPVGTYQSQFSRRGYGATTTG